MPFAARLDFVARGDFVPELNACGAVEAAVRLLVPVRRAVGVLGDRGRAEEVVESECGLCFRRYRSGGAKEAEGWDRRWAERHTRRWRYRGCVLGDCLGVKS